MVDKHTACVKWFNPRSGFGFLTDINSKDDVFVHHSELVTPENVYRTLSTGEYVEYETSQDSEGKTTAVRVTGIGGGPLLCESTARNLEERRQRSREEGSEDRPRSHRGRGRGRGRGRSSRGRDSVPTEEPSVSAS